jgi:23S rRNA (uracil1939-C5)-methyltransferase
MRLNMVPDISQLHNQPEGHAVDSGRETSPRIEALPPLCAGDRPELLITGISQDGQGIGRYHGLTIFVDDTVPGDLVRVQVEKRLNRYAIGRPLEILQPSPDRITAACSQSATCGGCSLQIMAYPAQLRHKRQQVIDALERIGQVPNAGILTRPIIGMDSPWQYRGNVQFSVSGSLNQPQIGFYQGRSHRVTGGADCPVLPPVCQVIRELASWHITQYRIVPYDDTSQTGLLRHLVVRIGFNTGDVMVILVLNGDAFPGWQILHDKLSAGISGCHDPNLPPLHLRSLFLNINRRRNSQILSKTCRLLAGQPWIQEQILGLTYRISPLAFFQVNPRQCERLFTAVLELAGLTGQETVLDLYCGTGSLTLQLAHRTREVIGIEVVADAVADAQVNARINGISNARFLTGAVEAVLPQLISEGIQAGAVVLDPPRKGCDSSLIPALAAIGPHKIIYVSCNPATLARDAALFRKAGYQVMVVQPVDMFPWTDHVETVLLMSREEK